MSDEFQECVQRLAEWSRKYPRGRHYDYKERIDEQLIEIEEVAKRLCPEPPTDNPKEA